MNTANKMRMYLAGLLMMGLGLSQTTGYAQEAHWSQAGEVSYLCGGVGQESRALIDKLTKQADVRLLLISGPENGYVSDVDLTLTSTQPAMPAKWRAEGPICLVKLPAGSYRIEALYGNQRQRADFKLAPPAAAKSTDSLGKTSGKPQEVRLHFSAQ